MGSGFLTGGLHVFMIDVCFRLNLQIAILQATSLASAIGAGIAAKYDVMKKFKCNSKTQVLINDKMDG